MLKLKHLEYTASFQIFFKLHQQKEEKSFFGHSLIQAKLVEHQFTFHPQLTGNFAALQLYSKLLPGS